VYGEVSLFHDWPLTGDGNIGLIPKEVARFGAEHSGSWDVGGEGEGEGGAKGRPAGVARRLLHQKKIKRGGERVKDGEGAGGKAWGAVDHPFSTDKSRAKKVDSWKTVRVLRFWVWGLGYWILG
jgi:hypothetical protein